MRYGLEIKAKKETVIKEKSEAQLNELLEKINQKINDLGD